jgi:RNA polymerase sigma factor (sigma-70 family)
MGGMRAKRGRRAVGRERAEARFELLYAQHGRAVLAYAVRRAAGAQDAADVVAETFLVAWRRLDDVPAGEAARLWLYTVARHVLSNQQRSEWRRRRLAERLRQELPVALAAATGQGPALAHEAGAISAALARLGHEDQEVLRLAAWEELAPGEIATVLGISQVAARSRLHRARRRLRSALQSEPEAALSDPNLARLQEAR